MCDTQVFVAPDGVVFLKNSDREPSEPQLLHHLPAGAPRTQDAATWITIPGSSVRHGLILSRPGWIRGGEMGVNEHGLAIGNEAVFTRLVDRRGRALLGMDLLRFALERCRTARTALDEITDLLTTHGQGGPAGFRDRKFRYDSSFLIADPTEAWILETAGRNWAARRVTAGPAAISNVLSLGSDFDLSSPGLEDAARRDGRWDGRDPLDFAAAFDTRLMPMLGRGRHRRDAGLSCLPRIAADPQAASSLQPWFASLRQHAAADDRPSSNADVCMHAASLLRPSQTTQSLVARLQPGQSPEVWATGTSAPCLSLFSPLPWGEAGRCHLLHPRDEMVDGVEAWRDSVWGRFEWVHRRALFDSGFAAELRADRDEVEAELATLAPSAWTAEAEAVSQAWHGRWLTAARQGFRLPPRWTVRGRHWRRLARMDGTMPGRKA